MLPKLLTLRKELHQSPELSGQEAETARRIRTFIEANHPGEVIEGMGGNGLAIVYTFPDPGPTVMIRCELDALPIMESSQISYQSIRPGIAHSCGHDGHMAIVAGLIFKIKKQGFSKGKIILLFQPAEETGKGAHAVLHDPKFKALKPDYIFALHNIPGEPLHSIIIPQGNFSATVQSLAISLKGKEAHAAQPENGINPALGMAEIIQKMASLTVPDPKNDHFALITPVYATMGQKAYGMSAGSGEVHYTLRTWSEDEMEALKQRIQTILIQICSQHKLLFSTEWFDYFPATENDRFCNNLVMEAAGANGFSAKKRPYPFRFGEDFGWFSKDHKVAMFGIGAGLDSPALHHAEYDFPDEIIETGIQMFATIVERLLSVTR